MNGTFTDDGSGEWVTLPKGAARVNVSGTFGGGTAIIQMQLTDGTTLAVNEASWTADQTSKLDMGGNSVVRWNLSGATDPDLKWEIEPLR